MDATTLATLASILQGQKDAPLRLGSNIVARNPDVEIAALTLKEIPLTADKFRELSNGQDWYRFSFTVLGVGPPGFSTVPYSSTRKKDEKPAPTCCEGAFRICRAPRRTSARRTSAPKRATGRCGRTWTRATRGCLR